MAQPNKTEIAKLLSEYKTEDVKVYLAHLDDVWNKEEKDWDTKKKANQWWLTNLTSEQLANSFIKVSQEWLTFDGKHVVLQNRWISYDYVAYKNKMLIIYPESLIDIELVYKWDTFSFSKDSWKVIYTHEMANPFSQKEADIIWWYVVIKNRRWEFLTRMTLADLEKHKATAKTQSIWKAWLAEMYRKTLMKKACSQHFKDEFQGIEEEDNKDYDPTVTTPQKRWYIDEINEITTLTELVAYYNAHEWLWKEFAAECTRRKQEIQEQMKKDAEVAPE